MSSLRSLVQKDKSLIPMTSGANYIKISDLSSDSHDRKTSKIIGLSYYFTDEEIVNVFKKWLDNGNNVSEIADIIEIWVGYNAQYLRKAIIIKIIDMLPLLPFHVRNRMKLVLIRSRKSAVMRILRRQYLPDNYLLRKHNIRQLSYGSQPSCSDISHEDFVKQITLMQNAVLRKITHRCFKDKSWVTGGNGIFLKRTPITDFIQIHNWITHYIGTIILISSPDEREMNKKLEYAIHAADYALQIRNFDLTAAIINGLVQNPIDRLDPIFKILDPLSCRKFEHLSNLFSPINNFKNYRSYLESLGPHCHCIPYMAVFQKDFTAIMDGNPRYLNSKSSINNTSSEINFHRLELLGNKTRIFENYKGIYSYPETEKLHELMKCCVLTEDDLHKISRSYYSPNKDIYFTKIKKDDLLRKNLTDWSQNEVLSWLVNIGLDHYIGYFVNINGHELYSMTETRLIEMGIYRLGHRRKILRDIGNYRANQKSKKTDSHRSSLSYDTRSSIEELSATSAKSGEMSSNELSIDISGISRERSMDLSGMSTRSHGSTIDNKSPLTWTIKQTEKWTQQYASEFFTYLIGFDGLQLVTLNDNDLEKVGMTNIDDRKKLLSLIHSLPIPMFSWTSSDISKFIENHGLQEYSCHFSSLTGIELIQHLDNRKNPIVKVEDIDKFRHAIYTYLGIETYLQS